MPKKYAPVRLQSREVAHLVSLLDLLATHLESAIDSNLIPGTSKPMPGDAANVAMDRRAWRRAQDLLIKIEGQKPRRPGTGLPYPPFRRRAVN